MAEQHLVIYLQIYKSVLSPTRPTSSTGFDITFNYFEHTLKQSRDKVVSALFQRCFNVVHWRCINVVQRWKSDVRFCFIFNVGSTLYQRWSTMLKQRWSDVEILAGLVSLLAVQGRINPLFLLRFSLLTREIYCWVEVSHLISAPSNLPYNSVYPGCTIQKLSWRSIATDFEPRVLVSECAIDCAIQAPVSRTVWQ